MANVLKISWWQWLPIHGWRIVGVIESADEIPLRLPRNGAILVGALSNPKWIAFDCPCQNGHRIMLNTDKNRWPYWSINIQDSLTISPSIDYRDSKLRCHYFIRNGRIKWIHGRNEI